MPVNPYDDRKVSLRRPHGNGDLDIVRASYTRRKANVTEALNNISLIIVRQRQHEISLITKQKQNYLMQQGSTISTHWNS